MIFVLAWKEFREHRSIWVTMVVMTALMAVGFAQLAGVADTGRTVAIAVLAMAATYGIGSLIGLGV